MAPTQFVKEPQPGDLIEISRKGYQHWAVYVGNGEVVHVIPISEASGVSKTLLDTTVRVTRQTIWDAVGSDGYRVNNLLDDKYQPRQPDLIVEDAHRREGQVLPYCIATRNCEHFVTELRYGKPESRQVRIVSKAAIISTGVVGLLVQQVAGGVVAGGLVTGVAISGGMVAGVLVAGAAFALVGALVKKSAPMSMSCQ
ncbi:phospholipase A and acyltransferase 4-like [Diretmus argenteus]